MTIASDSVAPRFCFRTIQVRSLKKGRRMSCSTCGSIQAQFSSIRARINPYHFHGDMRRQRTKSNARKHVRRQRIFDEKYLEGSQLERQPSNIALANKKYDAERRARLTVYYGIPAKTLAKILRVKTSFVMDEASRRGVRLNNFAGLIPAGVATRIRRYSRWLAKQKAKK